MYRRRLLTSLAEIGDISVTNVKSKLIQFDLYPNCWVKIMTQLGCTLFLYLHPTFIYLILNNWFFVSEKDRPVLRPARSMDSLSTPSYPNEGAVTYFPTDFLITETILL